MGCMMYDIVVFENLRFCPIGGKTIRQQFRKQIHSGNHFREPSLFVLQNGVCFLDGILKRTKNLRFNNLKIRVYGA